MSFKDLKKQSKLRFFYCKVSKRSREDEQHGR